LFIAGRTNKKNIIRMFSARNRAIDIWNALFRRLE
jgi:hypothetical protein